MFIPTTKQELEKAGWNELDVILVSGDAYIDSPFTGVAVIGQVLMAKGYKVGIIAQPAMDSAVDITRLGAPRLFWGVSSGSVDSMISNFTPVKKRRKSDDFTPGGINNKRPDRAVISYSNLIRQYFKNTKPIVIGGIEASLRRVAHFDYQTESIRKSILFDAKADYLVYGMGEKAVVEIAQALEKNNSAENVRGVCYISKEIKQGYLELPSFEETQKDKNKFEEMFKIFYKNNEPHTAKGLFQKQDTRYLIQNPPALYPSTAELDYYYSLPYERDAAPFYKSMGEIKALETIRFSITTHRGCYGECNFCAITVHQGREIINRSEDSIVKEGEKIATLPGFKGYIMDVGGPTANMYGTACGLKEKKGVCINKKCLSGKVCESLKVTHKRQTELLRRLRKIKGVKKVFVASGIRYDLIFQDEEFGMEYMEEITEHHVSGQLKIAPEHTEGKVLSLMSKPGSEYLVKFKSEFDRLSRKVGKKQFLTYYFIAAHPGCSDTEMLKMKTFVKTVLKISPEQVQIFTPSPSTYSTLMYYTEKNPFDGSHIFVEKETGKKEKQKKIITD
ncbi:MAG: YgiQ family radical SAM protein [bacterium]